MDVTIRANGQETQKPRAAHRKARVYRERYVRRRHGQLLPVSLAYFDRAPFKFNGSIERVHVTYLPAAKE
jgi:arylsulfatase